MLTDDAKRPEQARRGELSLPSLRSSLLLGVWAVARYSHSRRNGRPITVTALVGSIAAVRLHRESVAKQPGVATKQPQRPNDHYREPRVRDGCVELPVGVENPDLITPRLRGTRG